MGEQALGRTAEELVDDAVRRGGAGELAFHARVEAVRAPFFGVCDVAFVLEDAEDRLDGVVGEVVGETLAHFSDGRRSAFPQNGHDVELTLGEAGFGHFFVILPRQPLSSSGASRRISSACVVIRSAWMASQSSPSPLGICVYSSRNRVCD